MSRFALFLVIFFSIASFLSWPTEVMSKTSDSQVDCNNYRYINPSSFSTQLGFTQAAVSPFDDLILSIDIDADGLVDELLRVHFEQPDIATNLASKWDNKEIEIEIRKWIINKKSVFQITPANGEFESFVLMHSTIDCASKVNSRLQFQNFDLFSTSSIAEHSFPVLEKSPHKLTLQDFFNHPLEIIDSGMCSSDDSKDPLWCMSGGPGAQSCSWSAGGLGPLQGGSCSVTCMIGYYACCGPAFGSRYCSCVYTGTGIGGGPLLPLPGGGGPPVGGGDGGDDGGEDSTKSCSETKKRGS